MNIQPSNKYLLQLLLLTQEVFDAIRNTPIKDKEQLKCLSAVAHRLDSIISSHSDKLHPDLGFTIHEYSLFKISDDGSDPTGWTKGYEEEAKKMLTILINEYSDKTLTIEQKNAIKNFDRKSKWL